MYLYGGMFKVVEFRFESISCSPFIRCYDFTSKRFKTRSEQESEKAVREAKIGNEFETVSNLES